MQLKCCLGGRPERMLLWMRMMGAMVIVQEGALGVVLWEQELVSRDFSTKGKSCARPRWKLIILIPCISMIGMKSFVLQRAIREMRHLGGLQAKKSFRS